MPKFDRVPRGEAKTKTARPNSQRAQIIAEYVSYIEQLGAGEAGRPPGSGGRTDHHRATEDRGCGKAVGEGANNPPNG